jgi:uncharacterized alkaline shock family protein YloU
MTDEQMSVDYQISENVLEAIVRGALEGERRARIHGGGTLGRGRGVDVDVAEQTCRVTVLLDGQVGEDLIEVGILAQDRIARSLTRMTGLTVGAVDVTFAGVYPVTHSE